MCWLLPARFDYMRSSADIYCGCVQVHIRRAIVTRAVLTLWPRKNRVISPHAGNSRDEAVPDAHRMLIQQSGDIRSKEMCGKLCRRWSAREGMAGSLTAAMRRHCGRTVAFAAPAVQCKVRWR